jgi:hypothetical protein
MYDYCCEFNSLTQYRAHYIDTNEKKAKLFRKGPTI